MIVWTTARSNVFYFCSISPGESPVTANPPLAVLDGVPIFLPRRSPPRWSALGLLLALTLIALVARRPRAGAGGEMRTNVRRRSRRASALAHANAELTGRLCGMARMARGGNREPNAPTTGENLGRLNERLAVIDAAQARLTEMTREVVSLKDILANKQARGAFGQGRMEAIVRDGLPVGRLRLPVHPVEPRPARLRHPPARR